VKHTTLNIEGMSCEHCVRTVTEALERLNGVSSVRVAQTYPTTGSWFLMASSRTRCGRQVTRLFHALRKRARV
jgi:cation transport ATPase